MSSVVIFVCHCYFAVWRIAAQAMFAIGYIIQFFSLCLTIGNQVFGCCRQKIFAKETWPIIFGILIAVASEFKLQSLSDQDLPF